ncbi:unnamed protein product, partial [Nippostrongylus brasiliensis]|uniref:Secreted protein n=1 Tax=Nippostrongylus brasiliensis TaxID=27835 RepID=A0A0N4YAU1_NIPBR
MSPNGVGNVAIGGESFFLSAIHSLVLSSPSDDSASDSNHSSSDRGQPGASAMAAGIAPAAAASRV